MRFKTAGIIVITTACVMLFAFVWQIQDIQRSSADVNQLGEDQEIQPGFSENQDVSLFLSSDAEKVSIGQNVNYTISYLAKKDLKNVRIVGALGDTNKKIYPAFTWNFGEIKAGTSGNISVPVKIEAGDNNMVVSRITLSVIQKGFMSREKREILATCDNINEISQ